MEKQILVFDSNIGPECFWINWETSTRPCAKKPQFSVQCSLTFFKNNLQQTWISILWKNVLKCFCVLHSILLNFSFWILINNRNFKKDLIKKFLSNFFQCEDAWVTRKYFINAALVFVLIFTRIVTRIKILILYN